MKKTIIFSLLLLLPALGHSAASYPGAVWLEADRDTSGIDGTNTQGFVRQGVELLRLPGGQPLQVYGKYAWRFRSINKDYYNSVTPYAGAMLSFKYIDVGTEFGWPHYTGLSNSTKDYSVFANLFRYFDLKEWRKEDFIKALPLTVWANAAYDLDNQNGSSTMGWVKLKVDTFWLPDHFMAGPFLSYDWRLRSQNADYFNMGGVSAGFEVGNDFLQLGAKYAWRDYPKLGAQSRGMDYYVTLYKVWDLKKK